jgi:chromosome partitioning protein
MAGMTECCSVCGSPFEQQFRYQIEEAREGVAFYCSQDCLKKSQRVAGDGFVSCDACAQRFQVELVSSVFYVDGQRRYACSMTCRAQLRAEAGSARRTESQAPPSSGPAAQESGRPPAAAVRPRVIAVFNHKGGTGKTTTAVNLAAGLAKLGQRTLLVDTDAQGNVAFSLNLKADRSLYHVVVMGLAVAEAAVSVREGLDVIASNESLAAAELYLAGRQNRDRVLARRLEQAKTGYDFIVVDCSPSLSLMNQNALVFADSVLVPVACDYLSLVGVRQVLRTVKNVNQLLYHPVQIWGVLPTFYDPRARICREALATLRDHFGERCLAPIRATMKVKEAPSVGQTIYEYAPGSPASEDYLGVARRVCGHQTPALGNCEAALSA